MGLRRSQATSKTSNGIAALLPRAPQRNLSANCVEVSASNDWCPCSDGVFITFGLNSQPTFGTREKIHWDNRLGWRGLVVLGKLYGFLYWHNCEPHTHWGSSDVKIVGSFSCLSCVVFSVHTTARGLASRSLEAHPNDIRKVDSGPRSLPVWKYSNQAVQSEDLPKKPWE